MNAAPLGPSSSRGRVHSLPRPSGDSTLRAGLKRPRPHPCPREDNTLLWLEEAHPQWPLKDLFAKTSTQDNSIIDSDNRGDGGHDQGNKNNNKFYQIRLECREGGDLAKHVGEARLLLFRDDRPGAIAKLVCSSSSCPSQHNQSITSDFTMCQAIRAKVHVLEVKEPHRGHDLGSLLFSEAVGFLQRRHLHLRQEGQHVANHCVCSFHCELDAEEDCERHNKLVRFYEGLGFQVKPYARSRYIAENDQFYRKIPMHLVSHTPPPYFQSRHDESPLKGRNSWFVPVRLQGPSRVSVNVVDSPGRVNWLLMDMGNGSVILRTTKGHLARVDSEGRVSLGHFDGTSRNGSLFHLWRFVGARLPVPPKLIPHSAAKTGKREQTEKANHDLWLMQATAHGTFLSIDTLGNSLLCTKEMSLWQADWTQSATLQCTGETAWCHVHYQQKWQTQTLDYVKNQQTKYFCFQLGELSLEEALMHTAVQVRGVCGPEHSRGDKGPSLRSLCFQRAEWFRRQGYPDWVQLVALVYELGRILQVLDPTWQKCNTDKGGGGGGGGSATREEEGGDGMPGEVYDWTISSQSWVVGCAPPTSSKWFAYSGLNPDRSNPVFNSAHGIYPNSCGLQNVLLTWSTQQYMAALLRHNEVRLPREGFAMIALASLDCWHGHPRQPHHEEPQQAYYSHLADASDEDLRPFVADFAEAWQEAGAAAAAAHTDLWPSLLGGGVSLTLDEEEQRCRQLWQDHYELIAKKYNAGGYLRW